MKKIFIKVTIVILTLTTLYGVFAGLALFKNNEDNLQTSSINSSFYSSNSSLKPPMPKDFRNIIFNEHYNLSSENKWIGNTINILADELHFSGIQIYDEGSAKYGLFQTDLDAAQKTTVTGLMDIIINKGLMGVYVRTKVYNMFSAQRLEYEAEGGNNGFSYQTAGGKIITDEGRTVVYRSVNQDGSPGWLCENIYENIQHSDYTNMAEDIANWTLKPVMKIKTADASGAADKPVIAIVTKAFSGEKIDSVTISTKQFISGSAYTGGYISEFGSIVVPGNETAGLNKGRNPEKLAGSKIDFKIYWFGKVDVWFDKLITDNANGNLLFSGSQDKGIADEVLTTGDCTEGINTYYVDETTYANMECIKYIYDKIKLSNPLSNFSFVIANSQQVNGLRQPGFIHEKLVERIDPAILFVDPYIIPDELPRSLTVLYPGADAVDAESYNKAIQNSFGDKSGSDNVFGGSFVYQVYKGRKGITDAGTGSKLYVIPQMFGEMYKASGIFLSPVGKREPMNEEIEAQAGISIVHGADGLGWFIYQSGYYANGGAPGDTTYLTCLLNPDNTKRTSNFYGQNKWNFMASMNQKIKNWKPVLDAINWVEGYSVHSETADHNIIKDIKSIIRDNSSPYNYSASEDAAKYWEMGFFDPVNTSDKAKYFMMVNRRCIPEITEGAGDFRQLNIKFDGADANLAGFNNWKIIDVNTNATVVTIDKNSGTYYNFGQFLPGETKLYRIAPVM